MKIKRNILLSGIAVFLVLVVACKKSTVTETNANITVEETVPAETENNTQTDNATVTAQEISDIEMVFVEGGTFQMGSYDGEDRYPSNRLVHTVTISSFYMGKYEVTQKEWFDVMGTTIQWQLERHKRDTGNSDLWLHGEGDNYPMNFISWYEAVEYCNRMSIREGLIPVYSGKEDNISCDWNANGYRLPTEAEWEYAARGGDGSPGNYTYSGSNNVDEVAWYYKNNGGATKPVGTKMPNSLGLYDMTGNVREWCWDRIGYYSSEAQIDPRGPSSGDGRIGRGGSWQYTDDKPSTYRYAIAQYSRSNDIGFRLARNAQ